MNEDTLLKKIPNKEFKAFAKEALAKKGFYKQLFYTLFVITGISFGVSLGYGITKAILEGEIHYLFQLGISLFFCFTFMIVIHELLHGAAYKLVGAKKVYYGAILSKFIFFAGCDNQKFNGKHFKFIALFPFLVISLACLVSLIFFPECFFGILTVLFIHTLACGGDFAVVNFIQQHDLQKIYTYDSQEKKETYFYLKEKTNH